MFMNIEFDECHKALEKSYSIKSIKRNADNLVVGGMEARSKDRRKDYGSSAH